jgi:hypothetical protein
MPHEDIQALSRLVWNTLHQPQDKTRSRINQLDVRHLAIAEGCVSIRAMNAVWEHGPDDRAQLLLLLALADFSNALGCLPKSPEWFSGV